MNKINRFWGTGTYGEIGLQIRNTELFDYFYKNFEDQYE